MRVDQVIAGCAHKSSGTSYYIMNACRALARCGVDVSLHSFNAAVAPEDGFKSFVYHRASGIGDRIGWSRDMLKGLQVAAETCDVFHTNGVWLMPNVYPGWVVDSMRKAGAMRIPKFVLSPHGMLSEWAIQNSRFKKQIFNLLFQKKALELVDMFFATSEKEYREIRALGWRQPIAVIPIGMDLPEVSGFRNAVAENRPGKKKIVFLGRIHEVKAIDRLIVAWGTLCKSCSQALEWEVLIAGPDGGARQSLEQLVQEKKIPYVRFVGEVAGEEKMRFLAEADILAQVSHSENFGASVAEALSMEKPVIASTGTPWKGLEGSGDIGRSGWWVKNDPETLARTLRDAVCLTDTERMTMGRNGRKWIERDFSWTSVGFKMKAVYEWLLNPETVAKPEYVLVD